MFLQFQAVVKNDGRCVVLELPISVEENFEIGKRTVRGSINGIFFRKKVVLKENNKQMIMIDKILQRKLGFLAETLIVDVELDMENKQQVN